MFRMGLFPQKNGPMTHTSKPQSLKIVILYLKSGPLNLWEYHLEPNGTGSRFYDLFNQLNSTYLSRIDDC